MMKDLSHWNFDEEFSAKEAALLIRGLDPNDSSIPDDDPVLRRLRDAYEMAMLELQIHHDSCLDVHTADERQEWLASLEPEMLHSVGMTITDEFLYFEWMFRGMGNNLFGQKFARTELARWLKAIGKTSQYPFDTSLSTVKPEPESGNSPVAPKMQRQEARIIQLLVHNGYEPTKLPDRPRKGHGNGVKSEIQELALKERDLFTLSTFRKAWDRLRSEERLLGGELEKPK
jgi:hypothetical protein